MYLVRISCIVRKHKDIIYQNSPIQVVDIGYDKDYPHYRSLKEPTFEININDWIQMIFEFD